MSDGASQSLFNLRDGEEGIDCADWLTRLQRLWRDQVGKYTQEGIVEQ